MRGPESEEIREARSQITHKIVDLTTFAADYVFNDFGAKEIEGDPVISSSSSRGGVFKQAVHDKTCSLMAEAIQGKYQIDLGYTDPNNPSEGMVHSKQFEVTPMRELKEAINNFIEVALASGEEGQNEEARLEQIGRDIHRVLDSAKEIGYHPKGCIQEAIDARFHENEVSINGESVTKHYRGGVAFASGERWVDRDSIKRDGEYSQVREL